ncbi:MAG TPA: hypothetical protein VFM70_06875 [Salinimicrobium sp.]|nr:hypothetical protein [Salinimicrobium sp.]
MGTWGTGISSNDVYEDINYEFFELYNQGMEVSKITERLISENQELIESDEDQNNFWLSIAKAQWECKALEPKIYARIKEIVESGKDIELWRELDASKADLNKRKNVLDKFLNKISTEKKSARKIQKKKYRNSIFEKGDCLIFKLMDGDYCGVFVLESEKETKLGLNLIVVTDIKKPEKPTKKEFEKANVLFYKAQNIENDENPIISWYYEQDYKKCEIEFEIVDNLKTNKFFSPNKDFRSFSSWNNIKTFQDAYYSSQFKLKSNKRIKLNRLRKKYWL